MRPLFSEDSLRILESLTFTRTLFAFDFDGTLSRIVPVPSEATMPEKTAGLLKELSRHAPVAVMSGRSLKDLRARLDFSPRYLVGNHGLEGLGLKAESVERSKSISASWKKTVHAALRKYRDPGLELEDKEISLAIHYRRCKGRKKMKKELLSILPSLRPSPRIIPGKCVLNLVPYGTPHKGIALSDLMDLAGVQSAFYIGDDDTDEDVFSFPDPRVFTVRVGRKRGSNAKYFIKSQREVNQLLKALIQFYQPAAIRETRSIAHARA